MQVLSQKDLFESLKRGSSNSTQFRVESWLDQRNRSVDMVKNIIKKTDEANGGDNIFNIDLKIEKDAAKTAIASVDSSDSDNIEGW